MRAWAACGTALVAIGGCGSATSLVRPAARSRVLVVAAGPSAPPPAFVMRALQRDWRHGDCAGVRRDELVYERLPGIARTALARHAMEAGAQGAYRRCLSLSRRRSPRP